MTATSRCCAGQGATARFVRLKPPDWRIDPAELAAAFTDKTRAVVLNTPLNPSASLIGAEDLALIAAQCVKHDCIAISDEVWEHCVFDGGSPRLHAVCRPACASARSRSAPPARCSR